MELAWNTQKNQMTDVKGKEMEQERKGKISNKDIDLERSNNNYDLVQSDKNLYQRVKKRVDELKENGSRVQKNSVVMYSNILTVSQEQAEKWGEQKTDQYFKACYDFFCEEFGKENVVSGKVHKDETTPHMHLHFVPVNKENGKLQARVSMNKAKINYIHDALPKFLCERGFEVQRASGKTKDKNIEDIHEYKQVQNEIAEKERELEHIESKIRQSLEILPDTKETIKYMKKETKTVVEDKIVHFGKPKTIEKETGNYVLSRKQMKELSNKVNAAVLIKKDYKRLKNTDLVKENQQLREIASETLKENKDLKERNVTLQKEYTKLFWENDNLRDQINDLKQEIKIIYKSTRELLKALTSDFKTFNGHFNDLVNKIKEKTSQGEFERLNKIEKRCEMDRGMER